MRVDTRTRVFLDGGRYYRVLLDGVEQRDCQMADDATGEVRVFVRDAAGELVTDERFNLVTERRTGGVTIIDITSGPLAEPH